MISVLQAIDGLYAFVYTNGGANVHIYIGLHSCVLSDNCYTALYCCNMLQVYVCIITGLNVWELRWYGVFQVLLLLMSLLCHSQGDHSSLAVLPTCIVDNPSFTPPPGHYPHD